MMDKYKDAFEKGADNYIETLQKIGWFNNPFIDKDQVITNLRNCHFSPYLSTQLTQMRVDPEDISRFFFENCLTYICEFIPCSPFDFEGSGVYNHIYRR
jgi:hypothetical protein